MQKFTFVLLAFMLTLPAAYPQWSNNPEVNTQITNLTGEQILPKIALAPDGFYYVGYFSNENNNYNIRLQKLDNQGNILWQENGLIISDHPSMSWITDWDMTVDHENHAVITLQDIRNSGNNNVVAYRISPDGDFVWGDDGIALSNSENFDASPKVTITAANNAVFAWQSQYTTSEIILQKINPEGEKQWGDWGIALASDVGSYTWPQLMPAGNDDFILKYYEDTGTSWAPTRKLFAQRFDGNGDPVWGSPASIQTEGGITAWTQILPMQNDGNDGFFITWHDNQISGTISSSWIQHVDNEGNTSFTDNGLLLSNRNDYNQFNPQFALEKTGDNTYIYWEEVTGDQNQGGVYGQKVTNNGELLWGDEGKKIIDVSSQKVLVSGVIPYNNQAMLIYKSGTGLNHAFHAQYLDENGGSVWNPASIAFASSESSKGRIVASPFNDEYWVFAFEDERNGTTDLFMQNLYPDGSLGLKSTVAGTVTVENDLVPVKDVELSIGEMSLNADINGTYLVTLTPGTYTISANHPYLDEIINADISLTEGETTTIDFSMMASRRDIEFILEDSEGNPVFPATVNITGPEDTYSGTASEPPLEFTGVPYGFYAASAQSGVAFLETETVIDESNGQIVITDSAGIFEQDGFISGVVSIEDGLAEVTGVNISSGDAVAEIDSEGNYIIALPPGNHDLVASHPYTTSIEIDQITVLPGTTSTNWDVNLEMLRRDLHCYIVNQDDQIIQGAEAEVTGPEDTYTFTTNSSTEPYLIMNVPYGDYTMSTTETGELVSVEAVLDNDNQEIKLVLNTTGINTFSDVSAPGLYPNPLKAGENLSITIEKGSFYSMKIASPNGNLISQKDNVVLEKGKNTLTWEAISNGKDLDSGLYILILETDEYLIRTPFMIVQ